jgi:hypothetical protein
LRTRGGRTENGNDRYDNENGNERNDMNNDDFVWGNPNMQEPEIHQFSVLNAGIQIDTDGFLPLDYFQLFITEDLLEKFVEETNRMADTWKDAHPNPKNIREYIVGEMSM